MELDEFEWDEDKAAANLAKHKMSFAQATKAFGDPFAVEFIDDRQDYGETRVILLGMADDRLVTVVYTQTNTKSPTRNSIKHNNTLRGGVS